MSLAGMSDSVVFDHDEAVTTGLVADHHLLLGIRRWVSVVGVATIGLGALVLTGWATGVGALVRIAPLAEPVRPNAAVCLMLLGLCLVLGFPASRVSVRRRAAVTGCALLAGTVGLLTLAEYGLGVDLFLDRALFARTTALEMVALPNPGRMAPNTAAAFVLLSVGEILLLIRRGPRSALAGQLACLCAAGIGLLGIYGFMYRVPELEQFAGLTGMAVTTAGAVVLLSMATFFARPVDGLARLLTARGPSAMLTRRMLLTSLLVPPVIGWLGLVGQHRGLFGTPLGVLLLVFSNATMFAAVSYAAGARAARVEAERDEAIARDVVARNRADAAGRVASERLQRLAAIVDSSDDAIIGMTLDGIVTAWNPGAEHMFGYRATEMVGADIAMIFGLGATAELADILARIRAGHVVRHETRRTHKDGTPVDVSITVSPIRDDHGVVIGASAVTQNIDERKRAEARHRITEERMQHDQRLQSLGQLAGGVAHDFNNLLAVILNFTAFVAEQTTADEAIQTDLARIRTAAERATELTRQLLLFTRGETGRPQIMDVNTAIAEVHTMLARTIGSNIELIALPSPDPLMIYADSGQVQQVLINLVVNARDAMPDGGTIVIECTMTELDEHQIDMQPALRPGSYARLVVSDTGIGMNRDVADHIFEPFFTTKPKGEGTGLGLATVYGIVVDAGGSLNVYSEPNIGTTFRAYFPITDEAGVPSPAVVDVAQLPRGDGQRVLVVDDEDAVREVAARILGNNGYQVVSACGGSDALALDARHSFQLLLTDVIMPGMSGRSLAEQLRQSHPELPVLFMSGYSDGLRSTRLITDAEFGFIEKPFTAQDLLQRIDELLTTPKLAHAQTHTEQRHQ